MRTFRTWVLIALVAFGGLAACGEEGEDDFEEDGEGVLEGEEDGEGVLEEEEGGFVLHTNRF